MPTTNNSNKRFALDTNKEVNQFSYDDSSKTYHWSGIVPKNEYKDKVPNDFQKKLGVGGK